MALPATPERWPRRLARAGWRAVLVGAAAAGLGGAADGWPVAQGAALAVGGATFALDVAERAARLRAPDARRDLRLAAVVWVATACLLVAATAQGMFASAREGGASLEEAWRVASDAIGPALLSDVAVWLGLALATCVAPIVLLVRLAAIRGGVVTALAVPVGLTFALTLRLGMEARGALMLIMTSVAGAAMVALLVLAVTMLVTALLGALDAAEAWVLARVSKDPS